MTRISDYAQHTRTLAFITQTRGHLTDLQTQIASGRKSQTFTGISRDASRLVRLESAVARTNQYIKDNQLVERRLQTMERNVANIFELMTEFKTLLVNGLNSQNANDLDMDVRSQQILNQVAALMNVEEDDRYLFAGGRTDTAPVDTGLLPATYGLPAAVVTVDGDSSAYYVGDSTSLVIRADDNLDIAYNITADTRGFERSIRALDIVIKDGPTDRAVLNEALRVVNGALSDIANTRTRLGTDQKTLSGVNIKHREFLVFTEEAISNIENVDVAEAVTRMNSAQLTLEASFMTLARLAQTSLMNFLR